MSARQTALTMSAYTLDGNNHLADLKVFGFDIGATEQERQGLAAVSAYTQVTKRAATHSFELVMNNSGAAYSNLDVSAYSPGTDLLADLRSGTLTMTVPTQDGSGVADVFEFPNVVGARRFSIEAEHLIPSSATAVTLLSNARSATQSDWTKANVTLNLGGASFDLPMTLTSVSHGVQLDGLQTYRASFVLRGTPTTAPSGTTLFGVAFGTAGDALITLAANMGFDSWGGVGVVTSLSLAWDSGQLTRVNGTLAIQGQPTLS